MIIMGGGECDRWGIGGLIGGGAAVVALVWACGVFSEKSFAGVSERRGGLGAVDLIIVFELFIIGQSLGQSLLVWAGDGLSEEMEMVLWFAGTVGGGVLMLVYVVWRVEAAGEGGLRVFGFGVGKIWRTLVVLVVGGFVVLLVTCATGAFMDVATDSPKIGHVALERMLETRSGLKLFLMVVSAVVVAPVVEETLFRGMMQSVLRQAGILSGRWGVIAAASMVFTLIHVPAAIVEVEVGGVDGAETAWVMVDDSEVVDVAGDDGEGLAVVEDGDCEKEMERKFVWQGLVILFVFSVGLGYLYERSGVLWCSILVHGVFNGMNIVIAFMIFGGV